MKINRWIALAAIALLVVGAMGFVSYRVFATTNPFQTAQNCDPDIEDGETAEAENSDAEECEQQGEDETDANEGTEDNGQDQSDETAPASTRISADEAQAIAEEFDREGDKDIWEVELDNNFDVQVDANNGAILSTEQRD